MRQPTSCRDRHCPRCQGQARHQWAERQRRALLAVTYYHLVFTLPSRLNPWAELHPEVLYRLLFKTAWAVLSAFAQDPKRLGGQLGMTAVLHTWGQQLGRHLHLHCLIPGGAWTPQGHFKAAKGYYLFPVRALSRKLRGRMLAELRCQIFRIAACTTGSTSFSRSSSAFVKRRVRRPTTSTSALCAETSTRKSISSVR